MVPVVSQKSHTGHSAKTRQEGGIVRCDGIFGVSLKYVNINVYQHKCQMLAVDCIAGDFCFCLLKLNHIFRFSYGKRDIYRIGEIFYF